MICPSCGRTVKDGIAFCPHCKSLVSQPIATDEDKARESAEIEAALKSLDEIKRTAAKPLAHPLGRTAPAGVVPAQRDFSMRRKDSRMSQLIVAMLGALTLAVLLFVVLPNYFTSRPAQTSTVDEQGPGEQTSPIGDIPPIEELSAQDAPSSETAVIAYDAYDHADDDKKDGDESGYVLADSSTHAYTVEELEAMHLSAWDLEVARNEIYARHGRGFNDPALQAYFDAQDWYEKTYTPEEFDAQSGLLNQTELGNVATIGQVEDRL